MYSCQVSTSSVTVHFLMRSLSGHSFWAILLQRNLDVESALALSKLVDHISDSGGSGKSIFVLCLVRASAVHLSRTHWTPPHNPPYWCEVVGIFSQSYDYCPPCRLHYGQLVSRFRFLRMLANNPLIKRNIALCSRAFTLVVFCPLLSTQCQSSPLDAFACPPSGGCIP